MSPVALAAVFCYSLNYTSPHLPSSSFIQFYLTLCWKFPLSFQIQQLEKVSGSLPQIVQVAAKLFWPWDYFGTKEVTGTVQTSKSLDIQAFSIRNNTEELRVLSLTLPSLTIFSFVTQPTVSGSHWSNCLFCWNLYLIEARQLFVSAAPWVHGIVNLVLE